MKITEKLILHTGHYCHGEGINRNLAVCIDVVPSFLDVKPGTVNTYPSAINVTISDRKFKGSRAIYLKHTFKSSSGTVYPTCWTWTKKQHPDDNNNGGFYHFAADQISKLFTKNQLLNVTYSTPLTIYVKMEVAA